MPANARAVGSVSAKEGSNRSGRRHVGDPCTSPLNAIPADSAITLAKRIVACGPDPPRFRSGIRNPTVQSRPSPKQSSAKSSSCLSGPARAPEDDVSRSLGPSIGPPLLDPPGAPPVAASFAPLRPTPHPPPPPAPPPPPPPPPPGPAPPPPPAAEAVSRGLAARERRARQSSGAQTELQCDQLERWDVQPLAPPILAEPSLSARPRVAAELGARTGGARSLPDSLLREGSGALLGGGYWPVLDRAPRPTLPVSSTRRTRSAGQCRPAPGKARPSQKN